MKNFLKTTTIVAAVSAAILPSAALADPPVGFYGGLIAGYDAGMGTLEVPGYAPTSPYDFDLNGARIGGFVGYNFASGGALVYGIEAGVNALTGSTTFPTVVAPGETFTVEGQYEASLVGRVGGMAAPDVFVYGLAGASIMGISGQYSTAPKKEDFQVGYVVGVGVEKDTGTNAFIRGEVRYSNYPTFDLQCTACGPTSADIDDVSVSVGFGMRF